MAPGAVNAAAGDAPKPVTIVVVGAGSRGKVCLLDPAYATKLLILYRHMRDTLWKTLIWPR